MSDEKKPAEPQRASSNLRVIPAPKKTLLDSHRDHLRNTSGLDDESIALGGFYSTANAAEIGGMLNKRWKGRGAVLVLPFFAPGVPEPFFARARPDAPLTNKDGKPIKYEQPYDVALAPYFPGRARRDGWYADTSKPLVFVEGEKKSALCDQIGFPTVGSCGVWAFHDAPYKKEADAWRLHAMILKHVAIAGRRCLICFDSDAAENDQVYAAARRLAAMLVQAGASEVLFVRIPSDGEKKLGIDDFFVKFGEAATRALFVSSLEPITGASDDDKSISKIKSLAGIPIDERLRMPPGYEIDGKTGALLKTVGESPEVIERAGIFIKRLVVDLYSGHELAELVYYRHKKWRTVVVPRKAMVDARALVGELGCIGAPIDTNSMSGVVEWLRDLEQANEKRLERVESVSRGGWHVVGGQDVFVLGNDVLKRDGSTVEVVVERGADRTRMTKALRLEGSLEGSLDALRKAWAASDRAAATIAGALAAPMLRVLRVPTFAIHLTGDSSRGKSSMLKIAASVYGDPKDEEWVASWNSTAVGHEQRAAFLSGLCMPIDEAGVVDAKERQRVAYMLMNGVGRTRGAKDGGLRETQHWQIVVLSTGETKLADETSATGAQVRVLQLNVSGFGTLSAAGVDEVRRQAEENYGHVGRSWIETWLDTDEDTRAKHREALKMVVTAFQSESTNSLHARQAQWWAVLAYVESVAYEVLGLGEARGASMARLYREPSDAMVTIQSACDRAIDRVRHWMASEAGGFPVLKIASGTGHKVPEASRGAREVHGYIDPTAAELLILPNSLRKYLLAEGIDDGVVLREWREKGWLRTSGEDRYALQMRVGGTRQRLVVIRGDVVGLEPVTGGVTGAEEF